MKTKIKNKKTKQVRRTKTNKSARKNSKPKAAKKYPAYILGIVLAVFLFAESALVLNATPKDWQAGASVLDVSSGITSMVSDLKVAATPVEFTVVSVQEFYNQSAIAMAQLLDGSNVPGPMLAISGVNNFYNVASQQLAQVLDLSSFYKPAYSPELSSRVAGASIRK
ncbi:MAG TPA: hypothetical protein VFX17_04110 [Patescibacteria group bacterium]|nr:hypothetical protein [Patescibacteria group bacterium]